MHGHSFPVHFLPNKDNQKHEKATRVCSLFLTNRDKLQTQIILSKETKSSSASVNGIESGWEVCLHANHPQNFGAHFHGDCANEQCNNYTQTRAILLKLDFEEMNCKNYY